MKKTSRRSKRARRAKLHGLTKCPTGIAGLDEISHGGLPKGRATLVCGGPGCGKTLLGMEFLVSGAREYGEPGLFVSFEEHPKDLEQNFASLGYDLKALIASGKLAVDHVRIERSEITETGEYDLDGLFIRIGAAIDSIGVKRVVLDTIESLFGALPSPLILRSELRRLFGWLKERGVTTIITGEQGERSLTRQGLEEYVSDCVIFLDHRVTEQNSVRRLRIVKYRGSDHGTDEYPFLIDDRGVTVLPITSIGLNYDVASGRVSTGVPRLDRMFGGLGYFRGSTIMITGGAGSGKTTLAATFVDAACRRGERALYFALEESGGQIVRNMTSVGLDLARWERRERLKFHAARPTQYGLETHLTLMHRAVEDFRPDVVILDPVTNFLPLGTALEGKAMLTRLIDFLKMRQVTALFTSLQHGKLVESTEANISSLIDTWILVRNLEQNAERNRALTVLKSRGMAHSNQVQEFVMTDRGLQLIDVIVGPDGVLTGSARLAQEMKERAAEAAERVEQARLGARLRRKRSVVEGQIAALRAELEADEAEIKTAASVDDDRSTRQRDDRISLGRARDGHGPQTPGAGNGHAVMERS